MLFTNTNHFKYFQILHVFTTLISFVLTNIYTVLRFNSLFSQVFPTSLSHVLQIIPTLQSFYFLLFSLCVFGVYFQVFTTYKSYLSVWIDDKHMKMSTHIKTHVWNVYFLCIRYTGAKGCSIILHVHNFYNKKTHMPFICLIPCMF